MTGQGTGRVEQLRLSLMLVAAMCATSIGTAVLAHVTPVIENQVAREVAEHKSRNGYYSYNGGYLDDGDYLLIGQLPHDDYSRGGVYFLGASEMNTTIMPWTLPPGERKLIHNYSIGDLRHTEARHYVRMLVEENGLLQAGGEKTTVILGLTYQLARDKKGHGGYVKQLFLRHHNYTFDWDKGIHRVELSPIERYFRLERDRANRLLRTLIQAPNNVQVQPMTNEQRRKLLISLMPGDWKEAMRKEVQELTALIDYLQERKVRVLALLPPLGSWQADLPYNAAYREMVLPMLESRHVPVSDFSNLLADEEFMDHVHARYAGQVKNHAAFRTLALQELEKMGTKVEP